MDEADAASFEKLVRQPAGPPEKQPDASDEFGIPIQERVEHVDDDVAERAVIIDGGLPANRAIVSVQLRAAVFAVSWGRCLFLRLLAPTEAPFAAAAIFVERGSDCVADDRVVYFIRHRN